MATVVGMTAEKILQLLNSMVSTITMNSAGAMTYTKKDGTVVSIGSVAGTLVDAAINGNGELVFTKRDSSVVNLGKLRSLDTTWPVGSIYLSVNSTNPGSIFGGTWVRWGQGRVPVSLDENQTEFANSEAIGGEKTHQLTVGEMPAHSHSGSTDSQGAHTHSFTSWGLAGSTAAGTQATFMRNTANGADFTYTITTASAGAHQHNIQSEGGSTAHNNLQPYITCFMWKRIA